MLIYRRGTLDLSSFDRAVASDEDGVACVDLTDVSFIDAYGLVGLACYVASASGQGLAIELLVPKSDDVRSYLARMHLTEVLDVYDVRVDGTLPRVNERDRRDRLIELGRFYDSHGSHRLAEFIGSALTATLILRSWVSYSRRQASLATTWWSTPAHPLAGLLPRNASSRTQQSSSSWRWVTWASASESPYDVDTAR
jgi:hypothetical protein